MDEALVRERLKTLRVAAHMSQEELAEKVNLSRNSIGNLENGKTRIFTENIVRIAEALGVTLDELMAGGEQDVTEKSGSGQEHHRQPGPYSEAHSGALLEDILPEKTTESTGVDGRIAELSEENDKLRKELDAEKENNLYLRDLIGRYRAELDAARSRLNDNAGDPAESD